MGSYDWGQQLGVVNNLATRHSVAVSQELCAPKETIPSSHPFLKFVTPTWALPFSLV